ncbi:hypothetical protein AOLI_G00227530, partial [Acnodon oligacanthus]
MGCRLVPFEVLLLVLTVFWYFDFSPFCFCPLDSVCLVMFVFLCLWSFLDSTFAYSLTTFLGHDSNMKASLSVILPDYSRVFSPSLKKDFHFTFTDSVIYSRILNKTSLICLKIT